MAHVITNKESTIMTKLKTENWNAGESKQIESDIRELKRCREELEELKIKEVAYRQTIQEADSILAKVMV